MFDLKISGGLVVDGTGAPGQLMDIGIVGDRIVAMGDLAEARQQRKLMPRGRVVAYPGSSTSTRTMTVRPPGIRRWRRHRGMG